MPNWRMCSAYPAPANDRITIPLNGLDRGGVIEITDATGRVVLQRSLRANTPQVDVNIGELSNGVYRYALRTSDGVGTARTFQVMR